MEDGETIVRDLIKKILEENNWKQKDLKINAIPFEGANYTSSLFTMTLTTETETLELFAKVGNVVGEVRKQMNADWMYQTERIVYTKLFKSYEAIQDKHNVPEEHRLTFPKCYGFETAWGRETVVMENLLLKGYKEWNRFDCMDWEHAALSMEKLAKFHALSFAYEKEYPEEFKELAPYMVNKTINIETKNEMSDGLWRNIIERGLDVLCEEHKALLSPMMLDEYFVYQFYKPIGNLTVLVHGDYRLNNILFRRKGETLEGIPVDFQLVHSGSPAEDIIFFIFLGSDEEFRKKYFFKLLEHYYEHLCQALRRLALDPVEVYPRELFDSHMHKMLRFALFLGVFFLPMVIGDIEEAPKLNEEMDMENFTLHLSPRVISRLQRMVKDLIELGLLENEMKKTWPSQDVIDDASKNIIEQNQ